MNAIKKYTGNLEEMKREIMAAPYHITSTEEQAQHQFCPANSWCSYKNSDNKEPVLNKLPPYFLEYLLPVYEKLSETKLLGRCRRGATQNANESFNGEIWRRCSKTTWVGPKSVKVSANFAAIVFNSGTEELIKVQRIFGLLDGENVLRNAKKMDSTRMTQKRKCPIARRIRKQRQMKERQRQIQKEGVGYAAGKF